MLPAPKASAGRAKYTRQISPTAKVKALDSNMVLSDRFLLADSAVCVLVVSRQARWRVAVGGVVLIDVGSGKMEEVARREGCGHLLGVEEDKKKRRRADDGKGNRSSVFVPEVGSALICPQHEGLGR